MSVADRMIQASLLGEAVDGGPAAVFVADEDQRYVAVNLAACALTGYERAELLQLRVHQVAEDPDGRWEHMRSTGTITGTAQIVRKDGSRVPFRYLAGKTVVAGMPVFVSIGVGG